MAKYQIPEKRPFTEIIGRRKEFYQSQMNKVLEAVYQESFKTIEEFEQFILKLSTATKEGTLELLLSKLTNKKNIRRTIRLKLTFGLYVEAKENGLTNEEIKEKYRVSHQQQLGGFAIRYNHLKKE